MRCGQIFQSIQQCRMVTDLPESSHNNFSSCICCSVVCFDVLGSYYNIPGLYYLALIIACICSLSFTNNSKYLVGTTYFVFIMLFFIFKKKVLVFSISVTVILINCSIKYKTYARDLTPLVEIILQLYE